MSDTQPASKSRSWIRWPRGKYNGRRITGASIKFKVSVEFFQWLPRFPKYANCFRWLWFYVWFEWEYEWNTGGK